MRPRFQADADFNHKIVVGLRRRELAADFQGAHDGGVVGVPDPAVPRHSRGFRPNPHFPRSKNDARSLRAISGNAIESGAHHRVVGTRYRPAIEDLLLIWEATDAEEWVDGLGFVPV